VEDHPTPIDELERVFRIHQASDLLRAHIRYVELYESQGNDEAASRERRLIGHTLKRTLADPEADSGTLNSLAWFCATEDLYLEESLEAARRAVELEPDDTDILDTVSEVLYRLGRAGEALETIERALALEPDDDYLKSQRDRFRGAE